MTKKVISKAGALRIKKLTEDMDERARKSLITSFRCTPAMKAYLDEAYWELRMERGDIILHALAEYLERRGVKPPIPLNLPKSPRLARPKG